jgi:hypothetical protein
VPPRAGSDRAARTHRSDSIHGGKIDELAISLNQTFKVNRGVRVKLRVLPREQSSKVAFGRIKSEWPISSVNSKPNDLFLELVDELLQRSSGQLPRMRIHDRLGVELLEPAFEHLEVGSRKFELSSAFDAHKIT